MSTYHVIEITGPLVDLEKIKLARLPDFELHDGNAWSLDEIVKYVGRPALPQRTGEWHITHDGNNRWSADTAPWAGRFTLKHPTLQVRIREEWDTRDADEPGVCDDIYRGGDWIEAESKVNGEVPVRLVDMLRAATALLNEYDDGHPVDSEAAKAEVLAAGPIVEAFRALITALS